MTTIDEVSEPLEPTTTVALIRLTDGSEYEADVSRIQHEDAKVHESKSSDSGYSYDRYSYLYSSSYHHTSRSGTQKRPVVVAEAKITFETHGRIVVVNESQILAIEIPVGYVRSGDGYLTLKQEAEKVQRAHERVMAEMRAMEEVTWAVAKMSATPEKETETKRSFLDRLLGR